MNKKIDIGKSEFLLHNIIDKDIFAFFRPLNLMQTTFFMSMYTIKDNFITYQSVGSIVSSFLFAVSAGLMFTTRVLINDFNDLFLYFNLIFNTVYYSIGFTLLFCMCIYHRDININLVLKIQDLYRSKTISCETLNKNTKFNWGYVISSTLIYFITTSTSFYLNRNTFSTTVIEILCFVILLAFDVNILYVTQIIRLLTVASKQWVVDLKYFTDIKGIAKSLKENRKESYACWKALSRSFANILEAFEYTKKAFQLLILYHCTETFVHAIFNVYIITVLLATNEYHTKTDVALIIGWIIKNFIFEAVLCVELERLYMAINDAKVISILQLTNKDCSESEKRMHKNMVRTARMSRKFEVCNVFRLDATTPRRLLALIATYTIVLLQFVLIR